MIYEESIPKHVPEESFVYLKSGIIFIHGLEQTSFAFRDYSKRIKNSLVLNINLTGFGKSHNPFIQKTNFIGVVCQDLMEIIQVYNKQYPLIHWNIIAFSYGSYILLKTLIENPILSIENLILVSPYGFFPSLGYIKLSIGFFIENQIQKKWIKFINMFQSYKEFVIHKYNYSHDMISDGVSNGIVKEPLCERLEGFKIPITLIYGEKDIITNCQQGERLKDIYPSVIRDIYILKNLGHVLLYDQKFYDLLDKILETKNLF